jgi:hypothetical protein
MWRPKYKAKFNKIIDDTCQVLQPKLLFRMSRPRFRIFHGSSSNTCTWFRNHKSTIIIYHQQCEDQDKTQQIHLCWHLYNFATKLLSIYQDQDLWYFIDLHQTLVHDLGTKNNKNNTPSTMWRPRSKTKFNKFTYIDNYIILQPKLLSIMSRPRSRIFHWSSSNTCP